jgi:CNP1-like family
MLNRFVGRRTAKCVSFAWQESKVTLPAAPQAADLLSFHVSPTASLRFMIDAKSLSLTNEGVVRYTLVGVSDSGVKNISHEGIRCATFEYKTYAYGATDGSWRTSRRDQWQRILNNVSNRAQAALAFDFFCQSKIVASKVPEMLEKIRNEQLK